MRNASKTLREGTFVTWVVGAMDCMHTSAADDEETLLCVLNTSGASAAMMAPETLAGRRRSAIGSRVNALPCGAKA